MKRHLFVLVLTLVANSTVHGAETLVEYLQLENGGVGVRSTELSTLQSLACHTSSPNYYAANALLAAYHIHASEKDGKFTNSYKYAMVALSSPSKGWESIYAGLTLVTIEGACHRQNYTNQIDAITNVLGAIDKSNWESQSNPVYSLLNSKGISFGVDTIGDFLKAQLVNAYCNIGQEGLAEEVIPAIRDTAIAQRARGQIALERKVKAERERRSKDATTKSVP